MMVVLMVACGVVACRQVDIRTKTIKVAQMKNAGCEKIVMTALARTDGVFPEKIAVGAGQVTVTYDSMKVGLKNLEYVIAASGFDAGGTPADSKARAALPLEFR
jgi:copper chaperone CopZ